MSGAHRFAVVGHIEWLDLAVVDHLPVAGEIVTATEHIETAAGGGAVAAVQLRRLAGSVAFFSALGDDALAARSAQELRAVHGVELHAAARAGRRQRRAFTHVDRHAERTITVLAERLVPHGEDPLPWAALADVDALYYTGGDAAAARAARQAEIVVATGRAPESLLEAGVVPDVVVASENDAKERAGAERLWVLGASERASGVPDGERELSDVVGPSWVVWTDGARGGRWEGADGSSGSWSPVPPPAAPLDAYGAGDSFAAGLTFGLGSGLAIEDAIALGARCGAWCVSGRGPYGNQLSAADL
jgi:ribokinase